MLVETAHSNLTASAAEPSCARVPLLARVRLLADDLTGACDAAAAFLAAGHSVRVWFGAAALYPAAESAQAFHTASRHLAPDEAAEAVASAAQSLDGSPDDTAGTLLFKKVDSAGRGAIGAELLAAHRVLRTQAILLAPAFPAMRRAVRNGILEVRDASGETRKVPLAGLFPAEMRETIALIAHARDLAAALDASKTLLLCDSETDEELDALARAAEPLAGLLYAGSAGLARAIARLHPAPKPAIDTVVGAAINAPRAAAKRVLVIAGSPHAVTKLQIAQLESAGYSTSSVQILRFDSTSSGAAFARETYSPADLMAMRAETTAAILSAFDSFDPEALILTGGDTAQVVAETLGANSILLQGELAAGMPWGILQGGRAQGHIAVTKSGGFGGASALCDLVTKLTGAA
jgi:uncharacterized protein YgbK (DUF1537 family)